MSEISTVPTIITQAQYNDAFFAVTRSNADLFLLWNNGKNTLWVGRDEQNWKDFDPRTNNDCEVSDEEVTDENGKRYETPCFICPCVSCCNSLDLDFLKNGKIVWR